MSKDIGLVKTRDLIIEKLDAETKEPVSGAGFEVYGPLLRIALELLRQRKRS